MDNLSPMKKCISWILVLAGLFGFTGLMAQDLEVTDANTPPFTPENLITNIFLGDGVEVLSVTFEGDPLAVGYFKNAQNEVGIDRGIIMTSGRAASSNINCTGPLGANCTGNQFSSNDNASGAGDADLASIAAGTLNDVAKFTITFIPTSDTLRFKYVFASEEYPEWACSAFNDVFGFFISGPGITGPFQNNGKNIALIPGTSTPVTINNIHPQNGGACPPAFAQFYNDNNNSPNQPVYDGFLNVFIAEAIVIPCETYTIKLAVADVGDSVYDTGVFLEAKSFGTGSLQVETETVSLDGTITEGCATGSITFSFPSGVEDDYPLDYTIIGTAENGVDYEFIPPDLFIPQGDSSLTINIIAILDALDEGLESIGIDIQRDICNRDTFWIFVRDNAILPPQLGPGTTICRGDSVALDGTLPIPLPDPPSFTNETDYTVTNTAPTYSPVMVAGVQPVTLGPGVIRSVCVNIAHKWVDDLDLFLISPGGQFIELSSDNGSNCDNYSNVCFTPTASTVISDGYPWSPCSANVEASFSGGTFLPEGVWTDLWDGDYPTNGTWQLLALDDQAGFNGTILNWTITFEPLYQLYYRWEPEAGLSCTDCPDPVAAPDATTTYTLTAWDTYGCEVYDSITIEVKDILPAPNVICSMVTNNSISFEWDDVPGSMGYQVNVAGAGWTVPNNGPLSHSITGLTLSDTITIQVFAIGECDGEIGTATCNTPACDAPSLTIDNVSNISCPSDTDGSIAVTATGGAGNYVYQIDTVSNTTGIFNGLAAGMHQVIVTDAWGCPNSIQVAIQAPDPLVLNEIIVNEISCNGSNDGVVTAGVSGGVYPYNFEWNGTPGDSILSNANPGVQSVIVTDANGCTATAAMNLTEPEVLALTISADSANCFGASDGAVMVDIAGGTAPHLIEWDAAAGNSTNPQVPGLPAGSYTVLVSDINGCQQTATIAISEPEQILTSIASQNPLCNGAADGTATVNVTGGIPNFTYQWSNGSSSPTTNALGASTYSVTITDGNACTTVDSVSLTQPDPIAVVFQPQDVSCFNGLDGGISTQASGGTEPYAYLWSNGATTVSLTNISTGNYCVTVTGANGCTTTLCQDILQPDELVLTTTPTNAGCNGGSAGAIDLMVTGGSGTYNYAWNTGATSQDLNNLPAGNYAVIVTDGNGCTAQTSLNLNESDAVQIQVTHQDVKCKGGSTGSIDLSPSGGSGVFTYAWNGPNGFTSTAQDPTGLFAGSYTVIVQDSDGCNAVANAVVVEPATAVVASIAPPQMICFNAANGTATATASGGAGSFTYAWSNGQSTAVSSGLAAGIFTVTVTDASGCSDTEQVEILQQGALAVQLTQTTASCHNGTDGAASIQSITQGGSNIPITNFNINWSAAGQGTPGISGLTGSATYTVTITNNLGCSATSSIAIGNPASIGASVVSTQDVKCARGSDGVATVTGSGGTPPYAYLWGSNAAGQTTATAANLPPGNFTVTVSDANGCSTTIQLSIGEPAELDVSFINEKVKCFGAADGSSFATPSGGTSPYGLAWSSGLTGQQASGLLAGTYTLTLTDANGCKLVDSTTVHQPAEPVSASFAVQDVSCAGLKDGSIQISALGGSPPYRYSLNGVDFYGSSNIIALESGMYDVLIKDKNGCTYQLSDIFLGEPEPLIVDLGPDTIVFYGAHIHIHPTIVNEDTLENYTFLWTSNNPQNPVNYPDWRLGDFVVTSPTTATLTVTNENGCTARDVINIFVREVRGVNVPTGFAPGSGGNVLNDLLHVHGHAQMVEKIRLFRVFDRWGELLYEGRDFDINDTSVGWDGTFKGKEMPAGVYVWYLEVDYVDDVSETYKGNTTLIR